MTSWRWFVVAADGRGSAERGKIEVDGDGVPFGGNDFDGGGIGGESVCGELELQSCTHGTAMAKAPAAVQRVASRNRG